MEGRRLKDDRRRLVRHLGIEPAHDAGKPCGLLAVGNDELISDGDAVGIIQRMELLPCTSAPRRQRMSCDTVVVVRVEGLSQLQHDEVRHVDDIVDRADARTAQTIHHPCGRGSNLHIAQDTRRETVAQLLVVDVNGDEIRSAYARCLLHLNRRHAQRFARQRGDLPRNPDDTEAVGAVCRQLELEDHIVEAEHLRRRYTDGCIGRQNVDAVHLLIGQTLGINGKLARRTHHAVRGDAAQLALRDLLAVGEHCADRGDGDDMTLAHIGCTRHDLRQLRTAHVQLTDEQMIGVRMRRDLLDAPGDDLFKPLVGTYNALDGHTGHRQAVGNLLRRLIYLNIILQPFDGNLHSPASLELM